MNFFQRVQLPERFKDKKPEEIEAEIARLEAFEMENNQLKARTNEPPPNPDESLKAELAQTQARLQELEALRSAPSPTPIEPPQRTSFLEDEDRAFAERADPIIKATLQNSAIMARSVAIQELRDETDPSQRAKNEYVLRNYKKEIDDLFRTVPLQGQTNPATFKNVVGIVTNNHFSDVVKAVSKEKGINLFESPATPGTASSNGASNDPSGKLTPGELHVAKKMKITPAQYLESKERMKITVGDTGYAEVRVG